MLGLEVCGCKLAVHFRIDPRYHKTDARQHVVRRHPVDVVLIDLCSHDDAVVVLLFPSLLPSPFLLDCFGPSSGVFVRKSFLRVKVCRRTGAGRTTNQTQRTPTKMTADEATTVRTRFVRGVAAVLATRHVAWHLEGVSLWLSYG